MTTHPLPPRESLTPMMQQWHDCKTEAKEILLLFRMGDFYEAFYQDAINLAEACDLTLTKRSEIPMSGIPHHQLETYLDRLIAKGLSVAVAEQTTLPKKGEGLVERKIVRTHTPGTLISSSLLSDKTYNVLLAISHCKGTWGIAFADVTTDRLFTGEFHDERTLIDELCRIRPVEIIIKEGLVEAKPTLFDELALSFGPVISALPRGDFDPKAAEKNVLRHFKVDTLDGFGLCGFEAATSAIWALLRYAKLNLAMPLEHIKMVKKLKSSGFMTMDRITQKNLELTTSLSPFGKGATLFEHIDYTSTPMGARKLRSWLLRPLCNVEKIIERQEAVEEFIRERLNSETLIKHLSQIKDLERLAMRAESKCASPKDLVSLKVSLWQLEPILNGLDAFTSSLLKRLAKSLFNFTDLCAHIDSALVNDPPWRLSDGGLFKSGFNAQLDKLSHLQKNASEFLVAYENRLREETGLKKLKVGYNRVFGYYIELSRLNASQVPPNFIRKQTLANSERFITEELKDFEERITHAEEKKAKLEASLFYQLREDIALYASKISQSAKALGQIDSLISLATLAVKGRYCRPEIDASNSIDITSGRHPVVEASSRTERFIPNDTHLSDKEKMALITGPNMGGKSTYLRQVALIMVLAQMGSFVPATKARLGLIDRLFTRIGASDDLTRGQSTFMVEMAETANILNNASERSLIVLDEIGRGTSTCDGIAIAKATSERLLSLFPNGPKVLFATHFFELTDLEHSFPSVKNYHVAVDESEGSIVFLRKIARGVCDKSYGVHVAKIAGVPEPVVKRAEEILKELEDKNSKSDKRAAKQRIKKEPDQSLAPTLFELKPYS